MQFIKLRVVSGDTSVHVRDSLESETSLSEIQVVNPKAVTRSSSVDTPGFDSDSRAGVTDTDILKEITKFLLQQCVISLTFPFDLY